MQQFFEELQIFFQTISDWLILMVVFTFFFFSFNVGTVELFGRLVLLPIPSDFSFAAQLFSMMVTDLAPSTVPLIVTSPLTAFVIQIKLSIFLSFLFTFPFLLYRTVSYIAPALYEHEYIIMRRMMVPALALFLFGAVFAYMVIVPSTFRILYLFAEPIGVTTFLGVSEFIGLAMALILATGFSFTLPVLMVALTALRVIRAAFWWSHARHAIVGFIVLSAIITPDGSGVSMVLLALPVSALYGAGAFVASRVEGIERRRETQQVGNY